MAGSRIMLLDRFTDASIVRQLRREVAVTIVGDGGGVVIRDGNGDGGGGCVVNSGGGGGGGGSGSGGDCGDGGDGGGGGNCDGGCWLRFETMPEASLKPQRYSCLLVGGRMDG